MAKRNLGRYSKTWSNFPAPTAPPRDVTPALPHVISTSIREYQSILVPQASADAGDCLVENLDWILQAPNKPALRLLLNRLEPWTAPEPRLSGQIVEFSEPAPRPPQPLPPAPPPFTEPEPSQADFVKRLPNRLANAFNRALFARDGLTREEAADFEAAHESWKTKLRAYERVDEAHEALVRTHTQDEAAYIKQFPTWETRKNAYNARVASLREELGKAEFEYRQELAKREAARDSDLSHLERLFDAAPDCAPQDVIELAKHCWLAIPLPEDFPRSFVGEYDQEARILLITITAPDFERVPLWTPLKTTRKPASERARRLAQQKVAYSLCLRLIHEIFATPELSGVDMVAINLELEHFGKRDGRIRRDVMASIKVARLDFEPIDIRAVDPKLCFRALKGRETPSFEEISSVMPLLSFDRSDKRIVAGRDVADTLPLSSNLAAMPWEDFEHIVRELFGKMFSERSPGAEVNVTRASRDYGVDALIYDPDPILGGKYVIQAKRYVNTVDVAAVRDLFGTVQNEGASKGFLVTTSSYGPDAHSFANGKPIVLIDGPQLLGLLAKFGYDFRIDLAQARRELGLAVRPKGRAKH